MAAKWNTTGWIMVAAAAALLWIVPVHSGQAGPVKAGQTAPDFSLPDLSGETVSLSDYRGQLVIIDFWATWCLPCRKSLPEMAVLAKTYREQGLVVLGLAIDDPASYDDQYIKNFIKKYDVDYRILRADQSLVDLYLGKDDPSVPTLFIIDARGRILEKHEGFTSGSLAPLVQKYLE